ncbi:MAG: type II secretion system GspH family protein [Tabrizicola sp.]|jgi:prepilin-type N-terminal cleavage/methylation domain-containing protein|nr:type II secretion system GspH family protein [Tabrizicola sp.]
MNRARAGYSLLEVLVAFAILTVVLSVILPGNGRLLLRTNSAEAQVLAQDYAMSRLERLVVAGWEDNRPLTTFSEDYRDWVVDVSIAPADIDPSGGARSDADAIFISVRVFDAARREQLGFASRYLIGSAPGASP